MATTTLTADATPAYSNTVPGMISGQYALAGDVNSALQVLLDNTAAAEDTIDIISPADASNPTKIDLFEATANGTNKVTVQAPSAIGTNRTLTLNDSGNVDLDDLVNATDAATASTLVRRDGDGDASFRVIESTVSTGTAPFVVASTTEVANLNAATVGGKAPAAVSGLATLNASSLVVQNPASASTVAGASKIPVAESDGTIDALFVAKGTPSAGKVPTYQSDGSVMWAAPPSTSAYADDWTGAYDTDAAYSYDAPAYCTNYGTISF